MYPENRNNNKKTVWIIVWIVVACIFVGLTIGCVQVATRLFQAALNGSLDALTNLPEFSDDFSDDFSGDYSQDQLPGGDNAGGNLQSGGNIGSGEYFEFPSDNRTDGLSYTVELKSDVYTDSDYPDTKITYNYAVISGEAVPNLEKINDDLAAEYQSFLGFYEDDFKSYMSSEDDAMTADLTCCVTYMTEDILSVVYQETITSTIYQEAYVYSMNFDMRTGMLLDNTNILNIDTDFVVDFRNRNIDQNGEYAALDYYSDEEIVEMMNDSNLILFYTPLGMEVGLDIDSGWATVTYKDYEKYLKSL